MNLKNIFKTFIKGTQVYSSVHGKYLVFNYIECGLLYFTYLDNPYQSVHFYDDGSFCSDGECMLWPSESCRDWSLVEKLCQYKKGEYICIVEKDTDNPNNIIKWVSIFDNFSDFSINTYCDIFVDDANNEKTFYSQCNCLMYLPHNLGNIIDIRLATCDEVNELYRQIDLNDLTWNSNYFKLLPKKVIVKKTFDFELIEPSKVYYYHTTDDKEINDALFNKLSQMVSFGEDEKKKYIPNHMGQVVYNCGNEVSVISSIRAGHITLYGTEIKATNQNK